MNDLRTLFGDIDLGMSAELRRELELIKYPLQTKVQEWASFLAKHVPELVCEYNSERFAVVYNALSPMKQSYLDARHRNVVWKCSDPVLYRNCEIRYDQAAEDAVTRYLWKKFQRDAENVTELPEGFGSES